MNDYAEKFQNQNTLLVNAQKSNSQEMTSTVESIKTEFLAQLEKFQSMQESNTNKTKEFIEQQAREMEQVSRVIFYALFYHFIFLYISFYIFILDNLWYVTLVGQTVYRIFTHC